MNTPNPFLKQLISNIASKTNEGRITELTWGTLNEARKKKGVKEGNVIKQKSAKPKQDDEAAQDKSSDDVVPQGAEPEGEQAPKVDPLKGGSAPDMPPLDGQGKDQAPIGGDETGGEKGGEVSTPIASEEPSEDSDQAQADAAKAKAELEKAKAEKDQAEKEIKKQSYIHLVSSPGVHFLLAKLVDHAFKTNTIDSLASEMTNKLKIQTPEEYTNFAEEMAPFKSIPGVAELLASMKGMATKQPDVDDTGAESREQSGGEEQAE
jgi:hypothetical protein